MCIFRCASQTVVLARARLVVGQHRCPRVRLCPRRSLQATPHAPLPYCRCLERAVEIVEAVRQGIKAAALVMLQPGQSLVQRSTVVLVNGSLMQHPEPEATAAAGDAPTQPAAPGPARRTSVSGTAAAGGRTNLSPNPDGQSDPSTLSRATTATLRRNRSYGTGLLAPHDSVAAGSGAGAGAGTSESAGAAGATAAAAADVGAADGSKGPAPVPLAAAPEQGQVQEQVKPALSRSKSYKSIKRESTAGDGKRRCLQGVEYRM